MLAPFTARTATQALYDPLPPPTWLVEGLIADGSRTLIFGEYESFKSWLLIDLAWAVANGGSVWGTYPSHQASVLYIDEEMGSQELESRSNAIAAGRGWTKADNLYLASWQGVRFSSNGGKILLQRLEEAKIAPEVVIIESVRATSVGNENDASTANDFWNTLLWLTKQGITVIVSHHMKKPPSLFYGGPGPARDRYSGNTAWITHTDHAYAVTKKGEGAIEVECTKMRKGVKPKPFTVYASFSKTATVIGEKKQSLTRQPLGISHTIVHKAALGLVERHVTLPLSVFVSEIIEETGCSKPAAYNAKNALLSMGKITISPAGIISLLN